MLKGQRGIWLITDSQSKRRDALYKHYKKDALACYQHLDRIVRASYGEVRRKAKADATHFLRLHLKRYK